MTNKAIAKPLKETASLIELTGGNPFRARALANAARIIERLESPVPDLIASGELAQIKGIGAGLVAQIEEILAYGSFEVRDDILGGLPPGLLDVLSVNGLGAKKARALWQKLGIQSLDDLEAAAITGQIADLEGFGEKSQQSILDNLQHIRTYQGKRRISDAWIDAQALMDRIVAVPGVVAARFGGDIARLMDIVEEIRIVVACERINIPSICDALGLNAERTTETVGVRLATTFQDGLGLNILFVDESKFGSALVKEVGPEVFVESFSTEAFTQSAESEESFFKLHNVPYVHPELRDLPGAFSRAEELSKLDLLAYPELKGVLHNHSTYSDGAHTLREMSLAVRSAGFEYFGICDHSQSLKIASGMSVKTALQQKAEVDSLNAEFAADGGPRFKVFFGVESDILADGQLDYSDDILAQFDFIVASIHVRFNMTEEEATERIKRAVFNPYTTILGHPTGRLLLKREGYPINHEEVLQACAEAGVSVEMNANPYRLDLDWRWIETAVKLGVPVSITPEAHSVEQLDLMKWGALVSRKGALTAKGCLNALSLDEFETFLADKRKKLGVA